MATRDVLVGFDGSDASRKALDVALRRARSSGGRVHVLTVVPETLRSVYFSELLLPNLDLSQVLPGLEDGSFLDHARERMAATVGDLGSGEADVELHVETGDTADVLIRLADDLDAAEILLGHKSYEDVPRFALGSVADKVVRYSHRTVTVVR